MSKLFEHDVLFGGEAGSKVFKHDVLFEEIARHLTTLDSIAKINAERTKKGKKKISKLIEKLEITFDEIQFLPSFPNVKELTVYVGEDAIQLLEGFPQPMPKVEDYEKFIKEVKMDRLTIILGQTELDGIVYPKNDSLRIYIPDDIANMSYYNINDSIIFYPLERELYVYEYKLFAHGESLFSSFLWQLDKKQKGISFKRLEIYTDRPDRLMDQNDSITQDILYPLPEAKFGDYFSVYFDPDMYNYPNYNVRDFSFLLDKKGKELGRIIQRPYLGMDDTLESVLEPLGPNKGEKIMQIMQNIALHPDKDIILVKNTPYRMIAEFKTAIQKKKEMLLEASKILPFTLNQVRYFDERGWTNPILAFIDEKQLYDITYTKKLFRFNPSKTRLYNTNINISFPSLGSDPFVSYMR